MATKKKAFETFSGVKSTNGIGFLVCCFLQEGSTFPLVPTRLKGVPSDTICLALGHEVQLPLELYLLVFSNSFQSSLWAKQTPTKAKLYSTGAFIRSNEKSNSYFTENQTK